MLSAELEKRLGLGGDIIDRPTVSVPPDAAGGRRSGRRLAVGHRPVGRRRRRTGLCGAEHGEARTHPVQRVVRLRRADADGEDHQSRRTRRQGPQRHVRSVRKDLAAA